MASPKKPAEDQLPLEAVWLSGLHANERGVKWAALAIALAIHGALLLIDFPDFKRPIAPGSQKHYIVVRKYIPPPPKTQPPQRVAKKELIRKIPIPDPTPDDPEPIREPQPEIVPDPYPDDAEFLIGVPDLPPGSRGRTIADQPLLAGVKGVTQPVRIDESYVCPAYPDIARVARVEGRVVLKAVIHADGTVGDVVVLSCTRPSFGFEDEAVTAVRQWRYEPALQNGHPVDVYFTILVDFEFV